MSTRQSAPTKTKAKMNVEMGMKMVIYGKKTPEEYSGIAKY
jgi:hypothetical protein